MAYQACREVGIPSIMMTDGPHGLRKKVKRRGRFSMQCSCYLFPTASCLACSWDRELIEKLGRALGEECQAEGVSIILGPAVNIKDPLSAEGILSTFLRITYLSSELAASYIKGVQSQGVGTSIKHFAANNQEHRRMSINAIVDERTLRRYT